jgi:dipeptidyl-peptidase-4
MARGSFITAIFMVVAGPCVGTVVAADPETLQTVAEKTDYQATSRHQDVVAFCEQLAKLSPVVRLGELGTSSEGRKLPLVILADPPIATAAEARASKKLVVLTIGNIHAGEVDGKEALLMLARDLATAKERPLLKDLILVFAPIFNADGNERITKTNRREQAGPADGVGIRANAQGFDLNRDFIKLESPEVRALVRAFNEWDPAVFVDCHTTNGSYHRYTLTYEGGHCPAGDPNVVSYVRDEMLPQVGERLHRMTGFHSYFYGNFAAGRTQWESVLPTPRFSTNYFGLRNRIGILSESYSYASFKERVTASRGFVLSILEHTAANQEKIRKLLNDARERTIQAGKETKPDDRVALQYKAAPLGRPYPLLGFVEEMKDGRRVATKTPKEYELIYMGGAETTLAVRRPAAYLLPAALAEAVKHLELHGIKTETLPTERELEVEVYRVDKITRLPTFQKHQPVSVDVTPRKEKRRVEAGTVIVRTAQPLGDLAVFLLEPQSIDGLVTWNFLDKALKEGSDYPVLRVVDAAVLPQAR